MNRVILLTLLFCLGGCANYQFELTRPEKLAVIVGRKSDVVVPLDPLEYHFRAAEGFLVVQIKNPTPDPVQLLGDKSSAIDARGEAHPLRTQTIPPGAFVKVILPPPRPTAYDPGPRIGFGFGFASRGYGEFGDPWLFDAPRTFTLYDEGNNAYWDWRRDDAARVIFTFERAAKTFSDEFTFIKRKAK